MKILAIIAFLAVRSNALPGSLITGGQQPAGGASVFTTVTASSVTVSNLPANSVVWTNTGGQLAAVSSFSYVGGKVGIMTSAPATKLQIEGPFDAKGVAAWNAGLNPNKGITLTNVNGAYGIHQTHGIVFANTNAANSANIYAFAAVLASATITGANSGGDLLFETADGTIVTPTEKMRILGSNGNVGINTTSPGTLLHMSSGTLTIDGTAAAVKLNTPGSTDALTLTSGNGTGSEYMKFVNTGGNGYVGLESSAGNDIISSGGKAYAMVIQAPANQSVQLSASGGTRVATFDNNGNSIFGTVGTVSTFTASGILTTSSSVFAGAALNTGTQLYRCSGGTFAGNIVYGAGGLCTGGTAVAIPVWVP